MIEDVDLPEGSIIANEVSVVQYINPDASVGVCTKFSGAGSLSQVLGLLVLGAIDIYERSDRSGHD